MFHPNRKSWSTSTEMFLSVCGRRFCSRKSNSRMLSLEMKRNCLSCQKFSYVKPKMLNVKGNFGSEVNNCCISSSYYSNKVLIKCWAQTILIIMHSIHRVSLRSIWPWIKGPCAIPTYLRKIIFTNMTSGCQRISDWSVVSSYSLLYSFSDWSLLG